MPTQSLFHAMRVPLSRPSPSRPGLIGVPLLLLAVVFGAAHAHAQAAVTACMEETGMALVGGHSAATAKNASGANGVSWLFGGPGGGAVYCGPELGGTATIGANSNVGHASYAGSTGLITQTIGVASPVFAAQGQGYSKTTMKFKFRVIPDDPTSTDPVTVDFVMRHRFFDVDVQVSGPVPFYTNSFLAAYGVGSNQNVPSVLFPLTPGEWKTGAFSPTENSVVDHFVSTEVQPNVDRYFGAYIEQTSIANGGTLPDRSSAMSITSLVSFEATTEEAATIVFEYEDLLGLAPPTLDSVPEPGLGAGLSFATMAGAGFARRRARRAGGVG